MLHLQDSINSFNTLLQICSSQVFMYSLQRKNRDSFLSPTLTEAIILNIISLKWSKSESLCKHNTLLFVNRQITERHFNNTMFIIRKTSAMFPQDWAAAALSLQVIVKGIHENVKSSQALAEPKLGGAGGKVYLFFLNPFYSNQG